MALFFQFDVRREFELPFQTGSHFLAFMCPEHNDAALLDALYDTSPLPDRYWDADAGHYAFRLYRPGPLVTDGRLDPFIAPRVLTFKKADEEVDDGAGFPTGSFDFKVGGVPGWMNYQVDKRCTCGGKMAFVCQTPDGFGFLKTETAPEQPDSFSATEYCLLLGNQNYFLACDRQCDPRAVIAACDN